MAVGTDSSFVGPSTVYVLHLEQGEWVVEQRFEISDVGGFSAYSMRFADPFLALTDASGVLVYKRRGTRWSPSLRVSTFGNLLVPPRSTWSETAWRSWGGSTPL